jgi:hypothetical protein
MKVVRGDTEAWKNATPRQRAIGLIGGMLLSLAPLVVLVVVIVWFLNRT